MTAFLHTATHAPLSACVELRDLQLKTDIGTYGLAMWYLMHTHSTSRCGSHPHWC